VSGAYDDQGGPPWKDEHGVWHAGRPEARGQEPSYSILDEPTSGLRDPDPAQVRYAQELVRRMKLDPPDVVEVDDKRRVSMDGYALPGQLYITSVHDGGIIVFHPAVAMTETELDALLRAR
jgi:hypothetical protein